MKRCCSRWRRRCARAATRVFSICTAPWWSKAGEDAEGEILKRLRRIRADLPIAVTFDYHTNLSPDIVANASVITGYKTYPHIDMYEAGMRAGDILARSLRGEARVAMAWGWLPLLSSVMRHAPEDGPSGDILRLCARHGKIRPRAVRRPCCPASPMPIRLTPVYPPWSWPTHLRTRGPSRGAGSVRAHARHRLGTAHRIRVPCRAAGAISGTARALGTSRHAGPILLIDHCDNCGSGAVRM